MVDEKERVQQAPVSETDLKLFALTSDKNKVDLTGPEDSDANYEEETVEVPIQERRSEPRKSARESVRKSVESKPRTTGIFQQEVEQELRKRSSSQEKRDATPPRRKSTPRQSVHEDPDPDPEPPRRYRYEDPDSPEITREKMEYLRELRNLGVPLAKDYTTADSLADIKYELEHHRRRRAVKERVSWILKAMATVFHLIEKGNANYGPFLHLDNWAESITKDMSQFEEPVETLYLQYFGRKGASNPWMQILITIGMSIVMHHVQYKLSHGTVLSSSPSMASSRPAPGPTPTYSRPPVPPSGNSPAPPPPQPNPSTQKRPPLQPPRRPPVA